METYDYGVALEEDAEAGDELEEKDSKEGSESLDEFEEGDLEKEGAPIEQYEPEEEIE